MEVGDLVRCINDQSFEGKRIGPPLKEGQVYPIKQIYIEQIPPDDGRGDFLHYDVGLPSEYNYITSQDTGVELPDGDRIHWCHPSRFVKV